MCEPSLIVGGLSAVATLASAQQQNSAANSAAKEASRASQAEAIRQKEFADRKMALLASEEQGYTPEQRAAQLAKATQSREQDFAPATDTIGAMPVYNDTAPEIVKSDLANAMLGALKRGKDYSKSLASLGAYGDVGQQNQTNLGRTAQNIGVLDGFSQGSLNALGGELDAASRAGQGAANNAGILGGLGALGSVYAGKLYGGSGGLGSSGIGGISGSSTF